MKAAFFLIACAAAAQTQTGGLKGVVVDAVTHQPVKRATVSLNRTGGGFGGGQVRNGGAAVTDAAGSFSFDAIDVGQVQIRAMHPNYSPPRSGQTVEIKPGEVTGPITLELTPGAVITGHVFDEDGDPLSGCQVNPHPPGVQVYMGFAPRGNMSSDIDGQFRIAGIPPGKYIVSVECQRAVFEPRPFSAGPDPPPTRAYPVQYYPGAADEKSSEVIDLTPGVEKSGVDFHLKPAPVTQVRGTFAGDVWRGHENLTLRLVDTNTNGPGRSVYGSSINQAKGTFEFPKVFPGSYLLTGFSNRGDNGIGVSERVEVKDQPVETILEWHRAVDVTGKVEIENHNNQQLSNPITILLTTDYWNALPVMQGLVLDDGSFTIKSVLPATWRIRTQGFGFFVKSAWAGPDELMDQRLDLSSGVAAPLRIVISNNTATIRGNGLPGQTVMAQMIDESGSPADSKGVRVDANRQYVLDGLPPGKYQVMQNGSGGEDPENAKEVTVQEGETVILDFKN